MKFSDQDAQDLTKAFREVSKAAGDYLYAEWGNLAPADSSSLGQMYVTLKNAVAFLPTQAAGIDIDEGQVNLAELIGAVKGAIGVFQNAADVKKAMALAAALIDLATAIPTGNIVNIIAALRLINGVKPD